MAAAEGFVDAMLASPLSVTLLSVLEAGHDADVRSWRSSPTSTPAAVDAAADAVGSMSFGELIDAAVYTRLIESGPWISDAPTNVAGPYRHAEARTSIAEAVNDRLGEALHAPLDRAAQHWRTDGSSWFEQLMPLFRKFDRVYGAGQFTWAGLWSVTDPPPEVHAQLPAAWEYEMGPVSRCSLPVRAEARIFEVHRPEDWAQLATEHPRQGKPHPEWELPGVNQHHRQVSSLLTCRISALCARRSADMWCRTGDRLPGTTTGSTCRGPGSSPLRAASPTLATARSRCCATGSANAHTGSPTCSRIHLPPPPRPLTAQPASATPTPPAPDLVRVLTRLLGR